MAIMTGVKSAQVLGPTTQKQADKSRQALSDVDETDFDASQNIDTDFAADRTTRNDSYGHTDGGRDNLEKQNGVDVIRPE
jgi:cell division protein FtsZ